MKRILLALGIVVAIASASLAQSGMFGGTPSPYTMFVGNGELNNSVLGNADPTGKTLRTPVLGSTTAVIITIGQSNAESAALGTFTVVNTGKVFNFNFYGGSDRAFYDCANPVLGAVYSPAQGSNSVNCQIGDSLVTAGTYAQVVMAPVAVGATMCSDWVSGVLVKRVSVLLQRLSDAKMTAASGFTGDVWILLHIGETDNQNGTVRATLATCLRNLASALAVGTGSARFFVATESLIVNVTAVAVTGAQADAVASGCTTCRAGANWDSLTGGTNRQADGTHWTQAGAISAAALDVTVITNCKNTAC